MAADDLLSGANCGLNLILGIAFFHGGNCIIF